MQLKRLRSLSRATKLYDLNKRQRKSVKNNPKYSLLPSSPVLFAPCRGRRGWRKRHEKGIVRTGVYKWIRVILSARISMLVITPRFFLSLFRSLLSSIEQPLCPRRGSQLSVFFYQFSPLFSFTFTLFVLNVINYFTLSISYG